MPPNASDNTNTGPEERHDGPSNIARSTPSSSRHPSPIPYPSPAPRTAYPSHATADMSTGRESISASSQLGLHRDLSNPFNHRPVHRRSRSNIGGGTSARPHGSGGDSDAQGAGEVSEGSGRAAGMEGESPRPRTSSSMIATRPPPAPPGSHASQDQSPVDSSSSSVTAVDLGSQDDLQRDGGDGDAHVGYGSGDGDDGLPPVIATDYCDSPAAVNLEEDRGGLEAAGPTDGEGGRGGREEGSRTSKEGSSTSSARTSTPTPRRTPVSSQQQHRQRAPSVSHSTSSRTSTGSRVLSGLSPSIRSKLPSLGKPKASTTRRSSLLPLPATTHREPTARRQDGSRDASSSSGSGSGARHGSSAGPRGGQGQSSTETGTDGDDVGRAEAWRGESHRRQSQSRSYSSAGRTASLDGVTGTELAAGSAAAALARRMTEGTARRRSRQSVREETESGEKQTPSAPKRPKQESFYQSQRRKVRERTQTMSDNEILQRQLAEDGLVMDNDGNVQNVDRGWGDSPSRGGSGGAKSDKDAQGNQNRSGSRESGARGSQRGDMGGDEGDAPIPPMPRRATFGTTVSYTSTIVYTSIFADIKNDSIAMAGEFVGTILFLITSLGAAQAVASMHQTGDGPPDPQSSTIENLIGTFYKAFATGTALYGTASIFYRFTGSIFNPSVSLALALTGVIRPVRFLLVSTSQMLGGIVAAYILHGLIPGETDINLKLTANANIAQGLFIETFATTTLILTVLMLGVEKHLVTPHAPLGFGLTLSASMLFAMPYTGAGINVARAFGPALVQGFQPYHWIYWLGPTIGAFLASAFYIFLRYIQYWEVNPGQDSTQPLAGPPEPGKRLRDKIGVKKRDALAPKT